VDIRHIIDNVVQRTMVLIAQLATAGGERAPLAHIADQVFLDLVTELEQQGMRRKVVADMFGLALRGYQKRVQRSSAADQEATLRDALLGWLSEREAVTREEILHGFRNDDGPAVRAILADLVDAGLVFLPQKASAENRPQQPHRLLAGSGGGCPAEFARAPGRARSIAWRRRASSICRRRTSSPSSTRSCG